MYLSIIVQVSEYILQSYLPLHRSLKYLRKSNVPKTSKMARAIDTALLFGIFLASGAFSIVLTRLPCYATMCPEDYFSFETTAHIGIYYATLLIFGVLLLLRTHVSIIRSFMGHHLANRIPVVGRRITIGGLLTCFWLVGLTGGLTAIWLPNHLDFWETRTDPVNWLSAKINLTISGVTAHYADILFGLLLIPTSRFSLVGRAFDLHQSTLLFAHKMVSYLFIIATFAHGGAYLVSRDRKGRSRRLPSNL